MKLVFLIAATLLISFEAYSQVEFNIFGGSQISTAHYKVNDSKQKTGNKIGFQAGIGMKVPFENNLYFAPAVSYSLKGYTVELDSRVFPPDPEALNNDVTLHTVDLTAMFHIDLSTKPNHFFINFGPSMDLQLSGKENFKLLSGETINKKMRFSFGDYGRYSISAIGRFGYSYQSGLMIFTQYNMGLGSINNADNGPNILHRVLGVSVAKVFK